MTISNSTSAAFSHSSSKSRSFRTPPPVSRNGNVWEGGGTKIREDDFTTPVIKEITVAAKSFIHTMAIYDQVFPSSKGTARLEFAWKTVTELVMNTKKDEWKEALQELKHDPLLKKKLITFVSSYFMFFMCFSDLTTTSDLVREDGTYQQHNCQGQREDKIIL
jgi:hypothetical protein